MMKFEKIDFTCPNCEQYYVVYDATPITEKKYNQLKKITEDQLKKGHCKHCVRKDPNIPTTLEMDGVLTPEDIQMLNKVVLQCRECKKWTQMDTRQRHDHCGHCGESNFDPTSLKSLRTYDEDTDKKRRPKVKK